MGRRAKAKIWTGTADIDEGLDFLENENIDEYDIKFNDEVEEILKQNNLKLTTIEAGEERIGIGVIIFKNDWDDGAEEIDLIELDNQIDGIKPIVEEVFKIIGIKKELKTYISSDYS